MTEMNEHIRQAIRIEMARRNLRQKELAERAGVSKQYLSQVLSGKAGNVPDSWEKILGSLGLRLVVTRDEYDQEL
jgi:transcriptional regulator with XRE-family HTH domain